MTVSFGKLGLRLIGPALFGYLLYRSNPGEIWRHLSGVDIVLYGCVFPLSWLAVLLRAERWRRLQRHGEDRLPVMQSYACYLGGVFWGAVTPGRIGEVLRIKYLRDQGVATARAVTVFLVDRLLDVASLALLALIPLVMLWHRLDLEIGAAGIIVVGGLGVVAAALTAVWVATRRNLVSARSGALVHALATARNGWQSGLRILGEVQPATWAYALTATIVSWTLFCLTRIVIAWSLNIEIDIWFFSGVIAIASLLALLPITVQGIGTRDVSLVFFLGWAKVPAEMSLALSALILFVMLINAALSRAVFVAFRPVPDRPPLQTTSAGTSNRPS